MAEDFQLPSDIELTKVVLTTGEGRQVDISNLVNEVSIYEALNQTAVYGRVMITDATNVITNANISGQEVITFTVSKMDVDDEHIFHVMKIETVEIVNNTTTQYVLTIVDRSYLVDSMSLVSQAYQGTISSVIQQLYSNTFNELVQVADSSSGTYRFVIPNWKPLEALRWLTKRAVDANGIPMAFIKTFRRGAKLLSFDTMMSDDNIVGDFTINPTVEKEESIEGNQTNYSNIRKKIQAFRIKQHGNAIEQIRRGTYSQTYLNVDTTRKSAIVKDFQGKEIFENTPRLNEYLPVSLEAKYGPDGKNILQLPRAKQAISYNQGSNFGPEFLNYDSNSHDVVTMRDSYNGFTGTYIYEMTVAGRFDLEPGRLVHITFPSNRVQSDKQPEENIDNKRSGKHLILACHHNFKKDSYNCILEVATDGFGEEYGTE